MLLSIYKHFYQKLYFYISSSKPREWYLTLSRRMSIADDRPKFFNFFPKIFEIQIFFLTFGFSMKMHSNEYKQA